MMGFTSDDVEEGDHISTEYEWDSDGNPKWKSATLFKRISKQDWWYCFYPANEIAPERIVIACWRKYFSFEPRNVATLGYEQFDIADLPNDFVNAEELEAILSNVVDRREFQKFEQLPVRKA